MIDLNYRRTASNLMVENGKCKKRGKRKEKWFLFKKGMHSMELKIWFGDLGNHNNHLQVLVDLLYVYITCSLQEIDFSWQLNFQTEINFVSEFAMIFIFDIF